MTEAEWLSCTDPRPMLAFLRRAASERKMRLLGLGCCRQFRDQLDINALIDAFRSVEYYADTGKTKAALKRARQAVKEIRHSIPNADKSRVVEWVALWLTEVVASENAAAGVGDEVIRLTSLGLIGPDVEASLNPLMRCVFGDLFRHHPNNPAKLRGDVIDMAKTIYDTHAFNRMPELADALEADGCTDADILAHCRKPGPHVRGCWVVDLLLGRE
ncbi:MAG TPA: hypothetical protein VIM11_26580 [Tepidisphaeraceae bacterium]|jgi:hypothetical protein